MKRFVALSISALIGLAGCQSAPTSAHSTRANNSRVGASKLKETSSAAYGKASVETAATADGRNEDGKPLLLNVGFKESPVRNLESSNASVPAMMVQESNSVGADGPQELTLDAFEAIALENNPTLVQATAQVRATRGAAYQAGLFFNPIIGYTGEQLGVNGTAGEFQGGFISQEFATGGKLRLSREKYKQRVRIAETNFQAQQQRVLNDVRIAFYRAVAAQHLIVLHQEILANGEDNLQTHKEMLNLGQTNQAGLLQAEVDLQQDRLNLKAAQNSFQRAWQELVSLVGVPPLQPQSLADRFNTEDRPLAWDSALNQMLNHSPELIAAWEKVRHDEITVERERVQPIPNVIVGGSVGRNYETRETVGNVSIGIPLPIFDRNQGTIDQAMADLSRSHAETRRLELELRNRLAAQYRDYQTAWQHVEDYRTIMLPKAKKAHDLLHASYKKRRAAWPDVLRAQRRHLELQAQHTNNLLRYREADVAIRGMLLTGGLMEPAGPISGGHIDATPKPR